MIGLVTNPPPAVDPEFVAEGRLALQRFSEAWQAFAGPQRRLDRLSTTAAALSDVLRRMHEAGMSAAPLAAERNWGAPIELRRGSPRIPAAAGWRALDRAVDAFVARLDDPVSNPGGACHDRRRDRSSRWPARRVAPGRRAALRRCRVRFLRQTRRPGVNDDRGSGGLHLR